MLFKEIAQTFNTLEHTSSTLEMERILADLFKNTPTEDFKEVIYLCLSELAPPYTGIKVGLGEKLVLHAISTATGYAKEEVEDLFKKEGDLGLVAEKLVQNKKQQSLFREELNVHKVYDNFMKIATTEGEGSIDLKIKILSELLNSADPVEAKYIARLPLEQLRLGVGAPTIMDALSIMLVGDKSLREKIEAKYNIHPDLGEIGKIIKERGIDGLKQIHIEIGTPIRPALAERLKSAEEILEKMGGKCAVEAKYDGFRSQCHKKGDKIKIFSRQMDDLTDMFPDLIAAIKENVKAEEIIFEGEALAYDETADAFFPFQVTMQRRRKYNIEEMSKKYPLRLFVFDVMYRDGESLLDKPYTERRKIILDVIAQNDTIRPSEQKIVDNVKDMELFFNSAIERGLEGIMAKKLDSPYIAGARKFAWIKLKRDYKQMLGDTIDTVILGYYHGKGSRSKFGLGGLLLGVYDEEKDAFKTIAKLGTGFTEEQLVQFKKRLDEIKVGSKPARVISNEIPDVWVEPRYVVEVKAAELTRSTIHTCKEDWEEQGYALRFPRLIGDIREDKRAEDATTVKEIIEMFRMQKRQKVDDIQEI